MWLSPLTITPAKVAELKQAFDSIYYNGNAHVYMAKAAGAPSSGYSLAGRLVATKSGWIVLEVPAALVRGAFDALHEPGAEYPPAHGDDENYKAHISVIRPEELKDGVDSVTERGHFFKYQLGPVQSCDPDGWDEMSKVWFIRVRSPELQKLRRTYGLSSKPNDNEYDFHITIAVRRKKVLHENEVAKSAAWGEHTEEEHEDLERRNPYNMRCPVCGKVAIQSCRCRIGNKRCRNGHDFHRCQVHRDVILEGTGHEFDGCSCGEKQAATGGSGATEGAISAAPQMPAPSLAPDATEAPPALPAAIHAPPCEAHDEAHDDGLVPGAGVGRSWAGKEATAAKVRHIVITGHSGAGKTTLAHKLALRLGLPLFNLDHDRLWRKSKVKDHPDRYDDDTKAGDKYDHLRKKIVDFALDLEEPHVLEGTQLAVDANRLRDHEVVVMDTPVDKVVEQRLQRDQQQGKLDRDGEEARKTKALELAEGLAPDLEEIKKELAPILVPSEKIDEFVELQEPVKKAMDMARELNEKRASKIPLPVIGHYEQKGKVKRDAFLYMPAGVERKDFAQCSTCRAFTGKSCVKFPKGNTVAPMGSCGLYEHGKGDPDMVGKELGTTVKLEAGYVERPVRCENCTFFDDDEGYCELFKKLNKEYPSVFDLKEEVDKYGCCNAQIERGRKAAKPKPRQPSDDETLVFDLDGTILEYDKWRGEDHFGQPRPHAKEVMIELQELGYRHLVYTRRSNAKKVAEVLEGYGIPFAAVNNDPTHPNDPSPKPSGLLFIDDRGVDARKSWLEIKKEILERV